MIEVRRRSLLLVAISTRTCGGFLLNIRRRAPLVRGRPLRRKEPLRRCSLRRAARERAMQAERAAFLQQFPRCAYPGCRQAAVCIHEIAFGRGIRQRAYVERCTWLPSCRGHNRSGCGFHDMCEMPIARQCALKQRLDGAHYDLVRINQLRGRADRAITEQEVQAFLGLLKGSPVTAAAGRRIGAYSAAHPGRVDTACDGRSPGEASFSR